MSVVTATPKRRRRNPPSMRKHATGQAFVRFTAAGARPRDIYLGRWGTPEAQEAYNRAVAQWFANGRQMLPQPSKHATGLLVKEVIAAFWQHAEGYYLAPDGKPTSELDNYRQAMRPLAKLYANTPASDFGPLALAAVREAMIDGGWTRRNINKQVNRLRSVFRWAASKELIPVSIVTGLETLSGLKRGRGGVAESQPVEPVDESLVAPIKPYVSIQVWTMVQVQILSGARPGEVVKMRPCDFTRCDDDWIYSPRHHKTEHHGHSRVVPIGPRAWKLIKPFIDSRRPHEYLFSPKEAERARLDRLHAARLTPLSCGNKPGSNLVKAPKRTPSECYSVPSYRRAIARACEKAFPPPEPLAQREGESKNKWHARLTADQMRALKAWQAQYSWHPHQLRHNAGTRICDEFDLETVQSVLGHSTESMARHYARKSVRKAVKAMREIG